MKIVSRRGFTLIELMLFLAIAGVLAVGIMAASGPAIARQRYNSGVQTFEDFLEGLYSSVTSVENVTGDGRSDTIIYGKFITFGEPDASGYLDPYDNTFHIYDIIGDTYDFSSFSAGNTIEALRAVKACLYRATITDAVSGETREANYCSLEHPDSVADSDVHMVNHSTFTSRLSVENTVGGRAHIPISGAIMIVRSPTTGSVSTYVTTGYAASMNNYWYNNPSTPNTPSDVLGDPTKGDKSTYLMDFIDGHLSRSSFDFCLYSEDMRHAVATRRNIRLIRGANNSSSVVLMPADDVVADSASADYDRSSVCQQ